MTVDENLYPALVTVCGLLLGAGAVLLAAPRLAPPAVDSFARSLPAPWLLPVVLLGVGGAFAALLLLRGLQ